MKRRVLAVFTVGACCSVLLGSAPFAGAAPAHSKQSGPPVSGVWKTYKNRSFDYNLKGSMHVTAHHHGIADLQGKIVPTEQSGETAEKGHLVVLGRFRLRPYTVKIGKTRVREYRVSKGLVRPANIMVEGTKIPGQLSLTIVGARGGAYSRAGLTSQGQILYSGLNGGGDCTLLFGLKKG